MHLIFSTLCLYLTIFDMGRILNHQVTTSLQCFLHLIPLYIVLLTSFGIFLYLLPGMCDPEIHSSRKLPFLVLFYFVMITNCLIYFTVNVTSHIHENNSELSNQGLLFYPALFTLGIHFFISLTDPETSYEEVILIAALFLDTVFL